MDRAEIEVEVVVCPAPGQLHRVALRLPEGARLGDALRASGLIERCALDAATLRTGIWCREQGPDAPLRDRDRVEIYRPLQVDPKEARRLRYRQAKARSAGG